MIKEVEKEVDAIESVDDFYKDLRPFSAKVVVEVYVRKSDSKIIDEHGNATLLISPESLVKNDKYSSIVGKVIAMGPRCFSGPYWEGYEAPCKIGDWITFEPVGGTDYLYKGVPIRIFNDDKCQLGVSDPSYITRS